jgi:hypothetical protein
VTKEHFNVEHIDYLKLDTHGNELDILKGGAQLLNEYRISVIKCEVWFQNFYRNQAIFSDIDAFLRKKGFMFLDLYPVNAFHKLAPHYPPPHNDRGMLYFSDAYYCLDIDTLASRFAGDRSGVIKCGLVLICLGYSGWGCEILKRLGNVDEKKIEQLFWIMSRASWQRKASSITSRFLHPALINVLRKAMRYTIPKRNAVRNCNCFMKQDKHNGQKGNE